MRGTFALLSLTLLAGCASRARPSAAQCGDLAEAGDGACDGAMMPLGARPYCLKVPKAREGKPRPLVIMLHGYGSNPAGHARYFGLDLVVDARGFLLATPSGTVAASGRKFWNAFSTCCGMAKDAPLPDDVAYLAELIADVRAKHAIDGVYLIGHSNGGFMAHRFACDRSELVDGVFSFAGTLELDACRPTRPVTVIHAHGDADKLVTYRGGATLTGTTGYAGAEATAALWAQANGCSDLPRHARDLDLVCSSDAAGPETEVVRWDGCKKRVERWQLKQVAHVPRFERPTWAHAILDALWSPYGSSSPPVHPKP